MSLQHDLFKKRDALRGVDLAYDLAPNFRTSVVFSILQNHEDDMIDISYDNRQ